MKLGKRELRRRERQDAVINTEKSKQVRPNGSAQKLGALGLRKGEMVTEQRPKYNFEDAILPPHFLASDGVAWGRKSSRYDSILAQAHELMSEDFIAPFLKRNFDENVSVHGYQYQVARQIQNVATTVSRDLEIHLDEKGVRLPKAKSQIRKDIYKVANQLKYVAAHLAAQAKDPRKASDIVQTFESGLHRAILGGAPGHRNKGWRGQGMQAFWILLAHAVGGAGSIIGPITHAGPLASACITVGKGLAVGSIGVARRCSQPKKKKKNLHFAGGDVAASALAGAITLSTPHHKSTGDVVSAGVEYLGQTGLNLIDRELNLERGRHPRFLGPNHRRTEMS